MRERLTLVGLIATRAAGGGRRPASFRWWARGVTVTVMMLCFAGCALEFTPGSGEVTCGDDEINHESEQCDGSDLAGQTCTSLGYYGGNLGCTNTCRFDLVDCQQHGKCGDGVLNDSTVQFAEECDGQELGGLACVDLGYYGGVLACTGQCVLDLSDCEANGRCGDGIVNGPTEECDGTDLGGTTCQDLGFAGGDLGCDPDGGCLGFDTSACFHAGVPD